MRDSLFRKLVLAIVSMDLSEAGRKELEKLLKDENRVQGLLDVCHNMQTILDSDEHRSRWTPMNKQLIDHWAEQKLLNAVATRPGLTLRRLSEIVEWVCGRLVRPGKESKSEYVERLRSRLSGDEIERVVQKIMEVPRSGEAKAIDEWFQQMARRGQGNR